MSQNHDGHPGTRPCKPETPSGRPQTEPWEDKVARSCCPSPPCSPSSGTAGCTTTRRRWTPSGPDAHIAMYAGPDNARRLDRRGLRQAPAEARDKLNISWAVPYGTGWRSSRCRWPRSAAPATSPGTPPTASRTRLTRRSAPPIRCSSWRAACSGGSASASTLAPAGPLDAEGALARGALGHRRPGDGHFLLHEPAAVVLDDGPDRGLPGRPANSSRTPTPRAPATRSSTSRASTTPRSTYSGDVFPYYLFGNMQAIGGIISFSGVFVAAVLYLAGAGCCRSARSR